MRNLSYTSLRNMIFMAFAAVSTLFCILVLYLGKKELENVERFSRNEEAYFQNLLDCVLAVSSVQKSFEDNFISRKRKGEKINPPELKYLKLRTHVLRRNVNHLKIKADSRARNLKAHANLAESAQMLESVANAMLLDAETPLDEREILLEEDADTFAIAISKLREELNTLLSTEFSQVQMIQKQGMFFYKRLKILLAIFLFMAISFSISASFLLTTLLKNSLKALRNGTSQISSGNLSYRFKNMPSDVIGTLMYDFNMMARRLEKNTEALQKANTELAKKAEELLDANRHKDRFLANMSHELRTPLNSIIGFSELIISKTGENDKIRSYAERILSAAEHLLELISGLLDVAKADAGVLKPVITDFDISAVLNSVCAMLLPLAKAKNLRLEYTQSEQCMIKSDEKFVRQILINLISNAIKFTKEGSVSVSLKTESNQCLIKIIDTGIGMTKEEQKEIFKDFRRLENGLTSNYDGVGLGLTLSKRLAEQIKAEISVESEKNKGSVFTVKIPKSVTVSNFRG